MQLLVENGASTTTGRDDCTALWWAAVRLSTTHNRDVVHTPVVEWLLIQRGADIGDVWSTYENWGLGSVQEIAGWSALLRIAVLRAAPPARLVAQMSPGHALIVSEGARLRARLPEYLTARQYFLDGFRPLAGLPAVLLALVYSFEGPITAAECWATGLGAA